MEGAAITFHQFLHFINQIKNKITFIFIWLISFRHSWWNEWDWIKMYYNSISRQSRKSSWTIKIKKLYFFNLNGEVKIGLIGGCPRKQPSNSFHFSLRMRNEMKFAGVDCCRGPFAYWEWKTFGMKWRKFGMNNEAKEEDSAIQSTINPLQFHKSIQSN